MTPDSQAGRLVVTWQPSEPAGPDLLVDLVAAFTGLSARSVRIARTCRTCGSDRHGRPRVVAADHDASGLAQVHVSISHSGGRSVAAVTDAGPVGVDVEALPPSVHDLTTWVRKESVVKATGHGLTIDPDLIDVGPPDAPPALVSWPASDPIDVPVWMLDLESPPGFVAAATVLSPVRPRLVTAWGAPGA